MGKTVNLPSWGISKLKSKVAENATLRKQRELDALTARDRELDMLFERLYEDNVAGKIDDARFSKMSKRYEQEQGENAKKIKALRLELKKDELGRMDIDDFLALVPLMCRIAGRFGRPTLSWKQEKTQHSATPRNRLRYELCRK